MRSSFLAAQGSGTARDRHGARAGHLARRRTGVAGPRAKVVVFSGGEGRIEAHIFPRLRRRSFTTGLQNKGQLEGCFTRPAEIRGYLASGTFKALHRGCAEGN